MRHRPYPFSRTPRAIVVPLLLALLLGAAPTPPPLPAAAAPAPATLSARMASTPVRGSDPTCAGSADATVVAPRITMPDLGRWGLMPARLGATPDTRSWLVLSVPRGYCQRSEAVLWNWSTTPLRLTLFAADGHTDAGGAFYTNGLGASMTGIGAWLRILGPRQVTVPPLRYLRVPLELHVPRLVTVGLHAGGLEARTTAVRVGGGGGVRLNISEQIGLRLYLTVPGHVVVRPRWSSLTCWTDATGVHLCGASLTNAGNVPLDAHGTVTARSLWGPVVARFPLTPVTGLLPSDTRRVTGTWGKAPPGLYHIVAGLWANGVRSQATALVRARATTEVTVWPPLWLIALSLLLFLLLIIVWRKRRRIAAAMWASQHAWKTAA
jgi:hypothetical protein